jgi:hypothetical protein
MQDKQSAGFQLNVDWPAAGTGCPFGESPIPLSAAERKSEVSKQCVRKSDFEIKFRWRERSIGLEEQMHGQNLGVCRIRI